MDTQAALDLASAIRALATKARKLPWLLASKIAGTASWLVQRQGATPVVWSGKSA